MRPLAIIVICTSCSPALARSPNDAPALPAPKGRVIRVTNVGELYRVAAAIESNTTLMLVKGTYQLDKPVHIPPGTSNVAIRGSTGNFDDVVLRGAGMNNEQVWHGIMIEQSDRVLIADLTVGWVGFHPIMISPNCRNIHVYHCRLVDAGEQFVKASSNRNGGGADGGRVEFSVLEYSQMGPADGYTNGVDVHGGKNWVIQDNLFRNIRTPRGAKYKAVPAVLMWNGAKNTVCAGNTFVNCDRAIAFGLVQRTGFLDHEGGVIQNNFIYTSIGEVPHADAGIHVVSPRTQVFHNTVVLNGTYPNAIETRFATTTGVNVGHNLCDSAIVARADARMRQSGNVTRASNTWFRDARQANLHLASDHPLTKLKPNQNCLSDWDGDNRAGSWTIAGADHPVP